MLAMFLAVASAFASTFTFNWTIDVDPAHGGRSELSEYYAYHDPIFFGAAGRTVQSTWAPLKCVVDPDGAVKLFVNRTSAAWVNPPATGATCTTTEDGNTYVLKVFFNVVAAHPTERITGTPLAGPVVFNLGPGGAALSKRFSHNTGHTYSSGNIAATGPGPNVECRIWQHTVGGGFWIVNAVGYNSPAGNYTCTLPRTLGGVSSNLVWTVTVNR